MKPKVNQYFLDPEYGDTTPRYDWWTQDAGMPLCTSIFGVIEKIKGDQSPRLLNNLRYARLYANKDYTDYLAKVIYYDLGQSISLNVCRSVTNTAAARIAKDNPRPLFLTERGDYSLQKKAQQLTQFTYGMFGENQLYVKGQQAFVDSCVWGTGVLKHMRLHGKIVSERVLPDEIFVDEAEARYGEPRQLHHVKGIDANVAYNLALAWYKGDLTEAKKKELWDKVSKSERYRIYGVDTNQIKVIESWHLRSGPNAQDGRHTICTSLCTLVDEPYTRENFPFSFIHYTPSLVGFWGDGLIAEIVGIQVEINTLVQRIKQSMELVSVPRVLVDKASGINKKQITNDIGSIVEYSTRPPEFMVAPAQAREVYEHLDYLVRKAYEIPGISQLSAASRKPSGLDSQVALREYQDIESERFSLVAKRYSDMYLDVARQYVELGREEYKHNKKFYVKASVSDRFVSQIKWEDVSMEDDKFTLRIYPTNLLPKEPAGRLQRVQDLLQGGLIDQEMAVSLLDFPDVENYMSLRTAPIDDVKRIISRIVDDGVYESPEPFMNLDLAVKMMQSAYLKGKGDNLPEDRLQMMQTFIEQAVSMLNPEPQAPTEQPIGPEAAGLPLPGAMPIPGQEGVLPPDMGAMPLPPEVGGAPLPQGQMPPPPQQL
jgi:hypothetical protein